MTTPDDTTSTEGLTQGDSSGLHQCEICDSPTNNTRIPLRHSTGAGAGADDAIGLRACNTCQRNLANVDWRGYING